MSLAFKGLRIVPPFVTARRSAHLVLLGFLKEFVH